MNFEIGFISSRGKPLLAGGGSDKRLDADGGGCLMKVLIPVTLRRRIIKALIVSNDVSGGRNLNTDSDNVAIVREKKIEAEIEFYNADY